LKAKATGKEAILWAEKRTVGNADNDPDLELVGGLIGFPTPLELNQVLLEGPYRLRVVRSLSLNEARAFRNDQMKNWPGVYAEGTAARTGSRIHSHTDEPMPDVDPRLNYYLVRPI
jgi:hypothetical protein